MMRTSDINNQETVDEALIDEFLTNAAWAIRSTHHSVLKGLVFGRDMLFDIPFLCDWSDIGKRRQQLIDKNNARENKKRVPYDYKVGQKALIIKATDGSHLPKAEDVHEAILHLLHNFHLPDVRMLSLGLLEVIVVRY